MCTIMSTPRVCIILVYGDSDQADKIHLCNSGSFIIIKCQSTQLMQNELIVAALIACSIIIAKLSEDVFENCIYSLVVCQLQ